MTVTKPAFEWHFATIRAWCRHNGSYCTQKQEQLSWNSEFLEPVNKNLGKVWEDFDQVLEEEKENCLNILIASVDQIRDGLKGQRRRIQCNVTTNYGL